MQTSEQIIIGELMRLVQMQAQEIKLLKARITELERIIAQNNRPRKDSNNSSVPPSNDENRPPRTISLREKAIVKREDSPVMREELWR